MAAEISQKDLALARVMEAFLRAPVRRQSLQDALAKAVQWAEGTLMSSANLHAIEHQARIAVAKFMREDDVTRFWPRERQEELVREVRVVCDADSNQVTIHIPRELLQCLEPQSMISF